MSRSRPGALPSITVTHLCRVWFLKELLVDAFEDGQNVRQRSCARCLVQVAFQPCFGLESKAPSAAREVVVALDLDQVIAVVGPDLV